MPKKLTIMKFLRQLITDDQLGCDASHFCTINSCEVFYADQENTVEVSHESDWTWNVKKK